MEAVTGDGEVIHGRITSARFWLISMKQARHHGHVVAVLPVGHPLFRLFMSAVLPGTQAVPRSGARRSTRLMTLTAAVVLSAVAMAAFLQGRETLGGLQQASHQLAAGELPAKIPASWGFLRLFSPKRVALFNRSLLGVLERRASRRLDGKFGELLAANSLGQLLMAMDSLSLEPEFKYGRLPPQLLGGGFGGEVETHLAAVERATAERYKIQLLGLAADLAKKDTDKPLREAVVAWQELENADYDNWHYLLTNAVHSWRRLERQPSPTWYPRLKSTLGEEGVMAVQAAVGPPFLLDEDGWRVAIKPRAEALLLKSRPISLASIESFRQAFSLLPQVSWDEKKLAKIAAGLNQPPPSELPRRIERLFASNLAIQALGEAWRPAAWHSRRPQWSASPQLLQKIVGKLVGGADDPHFAAFYWFVGEWAKAQAQRLSDPGLRRPYLELLALLSSLEASGLKAFGLEASGLKASG